MHSATLEPLHILILMPLRDDWDSAAELVRRIDSAVTSRSAGTALSILLVDDASIQRCRPAHFAFPFRAVAGISVLRLRRNLGHQRAIAVGLAQVSQQPNFDAVLVMDADGEDTPEGVVQLIDVFVQNGCSKAVFAERSRRSESAVFKIFYFIYKVVHRALTGIAVRVGNFSILPAAYLSTLSVVSELWNHYAAAVFRSRLPYTLTPIARGTRISGKSSMNFIALVAHGLSAISVFADVIGVRLLLISLVGSLLTAFGIALVIGIRLFTPYAIPGWATYASGTLVIILIQLITIASSFTFFMLFSRNNLGFVPARDFSYFVAEITTVYSNG
ncbi:MAG: glycosyltransferase [Acidobacteriaceae bacterium]|nr:glycosyltransferase [Acidobacteriaceae bacterium]